MKEWLLNPAVQAGVAPFLTALLCAAILKRLGWYWAGAAVVAGFAVAVYLSSGFQLQPWTSTRKIVALVLGAAALGLLLDLVPSRRWLLPVIFAAAVAAVLWVVWPVLSRREGADYWLLAAGVGAYAGWCAAAMDSLRDKPAALMGAAVALGFGAGGTALLGASALLGQWGLALGVSALALWLIFAFTRGTGVGSMVALTAGLGAGLIGVGALVYAKLPWQGLALLATVPLLAHLVWFRRLPHLAQSILSLGAAAAPAGAAIWFTMQQTGAPPL